MRRNQHITTHPKGGWQVKGAGAKRATVRTNTQKEAITKGRKIARKSHTELLVHGKNRRIRARDSYGNDPHPPKG